MTPTFEARMTTIRHFVCAMVIASGLSGCSYTYNVRVNGYTDPAISGDSFFVMENKDVKNPLLDQEIRGKIGHLLAQQAYSLTGYEQADYYLFFAYGLGEPHSVTVVMPQYYLCSGWGPGWGPYPSCYMMSPPLISSIPYTTTMYDRWLLINVVDGKHYRESGKFRTLWVGEARSTGASADLRSIIDYLLLAEFQEFGKNTGKAIIVRIKEQAPAQKLAP